MSIMDVVNEITEVVHRVRVKLYPNNLPAVEGTYFAKTSNEKALTIEDVCASVKERDGFAGNYKVLLDCVNAFHGEMAYKLCSGFAVNTGYYTVFPNVGGMFESPDDSFSPEEHPLTFRYRTGPKLKRLASKVKIMVDGIGSKTGSISKFTDKKSKTVNKGITGGGIFVLSGKRIRVAGDDKECGVYLEIEGKPGSRIKVQEELVENSPTKVIGVVPVLTAFKSYRVVVVTQYSGSGSTVLKKPRTIISNFKLTAE